MFLEFIYISS